MRWLAWLGHTRPGRWLIGRIIAQMSFALPVHRLRETDTLLAFHHPRPSYPVHILLVSRKPVDSLADLDPADTQFLSDLFATVQSLVLEFNLKATGYRLIVNGGQYQDFPHLHFHLIADQKPSLTTTP